jgi:transcriptional regulator with XRE-family HTH domain
MDGEKLKVQIGANIAAQRRRCGLTQAGLAEKLNYSDKAVSKWERGESIPDVLTMIQLAQHFGVTVDELLGDSEENNRAVSRAKHINPLSPEMERKREENRRIIQMLSSLLVWGIALLVYIVLSSVNLPRTWVTFVYAIPINAIVLLVLRSAWRKFNRNELLISAIVWGCLLSIHMTLLVYAEVNVWKVYMLGILGQAVISLWFRMLRAPKKESPDVQEESAQVDP